MNVQQMINTKINELRMLQQYMKNTTQFVYQLMSEMKTLQRQQTVAYQRGDSTRVTYLESVIQSKIMTIEESIKLFNDDKYKEFDVRRQIVELQADLQGDSVPEL